MNINEIMENVDVDMNESQEASLKYALRKLEFYRFRGDNYFFKKVAVERVANSIMVTVVIEVEGIPINLVSNFNLFYIGPRGKIYILKRTKRKNAKRTFVKINGDTALLNCQVD